ncbi:uncharacterized protein [Haliotis cracherodii]|uniref:uncharacterized protein n=1 Tax=Haliotis cracherodii TaxID=6455 RepID=UPI0039EB7007
MPGSTQVRETIELLSTLLNENGVSLVTAETFRLAKFNKYEATPVMWKLLFELVYFSNYGVVDESAVKAQRQLSDEEKCVLVKRELQSRGYMSHDFAHLPNDTSRGSRELLLAMAWLMCKETLIERFMDKCTSPLDENISQWCKEWPNSICDLGPTAQGDSAVPPGERVQRLLVLNSKLRLNLRRMYAAQQHEAKLLNKIENTTAGISLRKSRDNLSALEVHLLRHPHLLKRMLVLLDKDNERLQNLMNWRQHEDVFWKWMDSVLDLKVKAAAEDRDQSEAQSGAVYLQAPVDGPVQMQLARQQLVQSILSYESSIKYLEQLWETKRQEISNHELDNLIASINMDISVHKANLMLTAAHDVAGTLKPEPSFRLASRARSRGQGKVANVQHSPGEGGDSCCTDITRVTEELTHQIQDMRTQLTQMHRECQKTLMGLARNIPSAICIEPTAVRQSDLYA